MKSTITGTVYCAIFAKNAACRRAALAIQLFGTMAEECVEDEPRLDFIGYVTGADEAPPADEELEAIWSAELTVRDDNIVITNERARQRLCVYPVYNDEDAAAAALVHTVREMVASGDLELRYEMRSVDHEIDPEVDFVDMHHDQSGAFREIVVLGFNVEWNNGVFANADNYDDEVDPAPSPEDMGAPFGWRWIPPDDDFS